MIGLRKHTCNLHSCPSRNRLLTWIEIDFVADCPRPTRVPRLQWDMPVVRTSAYACSTLILVPRLKMLQPRSIDLDVPRTANALALSSRFSPGTLPTASHDSGSQQNQLRAMLGTKTQTTMAVPPTLEKQAACCAVRVFTAAVEWRARIHYSVQRHWSHCHLLDNA